MSPERAEKLVHTLLNENYWLPKLRPDTRYVRTNDDHDGTWFPKINVVFSHDGDAWVGVQALRPEVLSSCRFRTGMGGGASLRVRNALLILAEAIRLDNEDRREQHCCHHGVLREYPCTRCQEEQQKVTERPNLRVHTDDILAYADRDERKVVARLLKRVCEGNEDHANAAYFLRVEHEPDRPRPKTLVEVFAEEEARKELSKNPDKV